MKKYDIKAIQEIRSYRSYASNTSNSSSTRSTVNTSDKGNRRNSNNTGNTSNTSYSNKTIASVDFQVIYQQGIFPSDYEVRLIYSTFQSAVCSPHMR